MASGIFSHDELSAALRGSGVGVWSWSMASGEVRWSTEVETIFGVARGSFGGSFESYMSKVHKDDVERLNQTIEEALAKRSNDYQVEHRVNAPGGEVRWVESRGSVVLDAEGNVVGMQGTVVDSTSRRSTEEALRHSEERHRLYSELSSDYIYVAEMDKPSLFPAIVAGSFERTTGYTPQEVGEMGGWYNVVIPEDLAEMEARFLPALQEGKPIINDYRIRHANGEIRWLRDHVHPIVDPKTKKLIRLYGGVKDITESRRLEEQLLQAQKMDALARLAGGVAHDFNNLLTVVFAAVASLQRSSSTLNERDNKAVADIDEASRRAAELTRSLLAFSRKQVGLRRGTTVKRVLKAAEPMITRAISERVSVTVTNPKDSLRISVVPGQLQQVLLNLAINARDAMPQGGELVISAGTRVFKQHEMSRPAEIAAGTYAVIEVRDNGEGISAEDLKHIFEPFFTTKAVGSGTGLGLAVSHSIIHQAGGSITVNSTPDKGTSFFVYLPISSQEGPTTSDVGAKTGDIGGTEHILLVEDETAIRRQITLALKDLGYQVTAVSTAEEAVQLTTRDESIALVVSDVRLQGMDGTELAAMLRNNIPRLPILLMSGHVAEEKQREAVESGEYLFLSKPFTPKGLARRVREALDSEAGSPSS